MNKKRGEYQKDTITCREINTHIFQSGLIIRKTDKWCIVALKNGYSLIIETVKSKKNINLMNNIKVGDRFWTPSKKIESAKNYRFIIKN